MKKFLPKILIVLFATVIVVGYSTHFAHASVVGEFFSWGFRTYWEFLGYITGYIVYILLTIASWFLVLTGLLLNASISISMNIKDFVDQTPAVYTVWKTIRDISGLFIIFALVYAAIQMILGIKKPNFNDLIKNIVIAGILINFSFFITSVLIDASNMVSLAIYNAMVPETVSYSGTNFTSSNITKGSLQNSSQGISNLFMASLRIQKNFDIKSYNLDGTTNKTIDPIKNILSGITGIVMIFTTGMSFLFAALAFIIRTIILVGLLAFSPLWFASKVVPKIGDYGDKWWSMLQKQLLFMPAYLLLMYVALSIINSTKVFDYTSSLATNPTGAPLEYITFAINAAFIIIMLNLPLLAALELGAGAGLLDNVGKSINSFGVWKKVGNQAGTRTIGRAAYALNQSGLVKGMVAASPTLGGLVSSQIGKVSSAGFGVKKGGYTDMLDAKKKAHKKTYDALGSVNRSDYATDNAYKKAKGKAEEAQENYRANVPWAKGSILGLMLDNRANLQSQEKLNKEAMAGQINKNKQAKAALEAKLRAIDDNPLAENPLTDQQKKQKEQIEKEIAAIQEKIEIGEKVKADKELDKFAKAIADKNKANEEKPADGDKPKDDSKKS